MRRFPVATRIQSRRSDQNGPFQRETNAGHLAASEAAAASLKCKTRHSERMMRTAAGFRREREKERQRERKKSPVERLEEWVLTVGQEAPFTANRLPATIPETHQQVASDLSAATRRQMQQTDYNPPLQPPIRRREKKNTRQIHRHETKKKKKNPAECRGFKQSTIETTTADWTMRHQRGGGGASAVISTKVAKGEETGGGGVFVAVHQHPPCPPQGIWAANQNCSSSCRR